MPKKDLEDVHYKLYIDSDDILRYNRRAKCWLPRLQL
jgi:hypothetical protein